jgi:flagellar basal body rod protein FlgC
MSLVKFFLLAFFVSSTAYAIPTCEKPLQEIALKIQAASDNLAMANEPAVPGMWPKAREVVACRGSKCKVELERGVKLQYEPYNFYADTLGLVGYPDIDVDTESSKLASLEWEYGLQKQTCDHPSRHSDQTQALLNHSTTLNSKDASTYFPESDREGDEGK